MSGNKDKNELSILLERFKNNDQHAFDEIYKRCHKHIAFVCLKICDSKEDVEEIVQDTFMTAFKKARDLRGDTFLPLLRKIAARKCYSNYNKKIKLSDNMVYLDCEDQPETKELDQSFLPEEYLQNKERKAELLRIINDLPPKQREMIYLYYYAGISTEEIATLTNCPSSNVRQLLFTARRTIKSKIVSQPGQRPVAMAGVSLASVLFMEEAAFVAGYQGIIAIGALDIASKAAATGTAATSATGIAVMAACVVIAGAISVTAYLALQQKPEVYDPQPQYVTTQITAIEPLNIDEPPEPGYIPYDPPYASYIPQEVPEPEPVAPDPVEEPEPQPVEEPPEPQPIEEPEPQPVEEPEPIDIEEPEPQPVEEPPEPQPLEEPPEPEPIEEPGPTPVEEPEPQPEPEPPPAYQDRTSEILARLANAATVQEADDIIRYYEFTRVAQMRSSDMELLRFYTLTQNGGQILVGILEYADSSNWRIKSNLYEPGQKPTDRLDLLVWMEG